MRKTQTNEKICTFFKKFSEFVVTSGRVCRIYRHRKLITDLSRANTRKKGLKMKETIKIKTNQIYFEQFETLGNEAAMTEIKKAWKKAICDVIEKAKFEAEVEIGVGSDLAIQKCITIDAIDECDCGNPSPECNSHVRSRIPNIIEHCERWGNVIAEDAIEAGIAAIHTVIKKAEETD